ncbi:MAG: glycosyltransferase family 4 protein [Paludibacteraceae bacterium]|nr:glycosyltransferase family 4 protein [Paludibacteraceae bacterium]
MHIAFLIQDITTAGGTERTTCCLAAELARQGHRVTIVSVFRSEPEPHYHAEGVALHYLTQQSYTLHDSATRRLGKVLRRVSDVRRCEALRNADVIICQRLLACTLGVLAGFGGKAVACEHFKYAMYNAPVRWLRGRLYRRMRALVTLTDKDRDLFLAEGLRNVYCIPNMVSVNPLPYRGTDSRSIVSVGRLTPQKGYDLLLTAVASIADRMGDWHIDIYGEGEQRAALEDQCRSLRLTHLVRFCGYRADIEQVYADSAFYVMSSRFEGFPMVLLEAAACGLPIVSFRCPEGPDVLLADGGGVLVPPEDTDALAEALLRLINDADLREQLRRRTPDIVRPYQPERIGAQWDELLHQLTLAWDAGGSPASAPSGADPDIQSVPNP